MSEIQYVTPEQARQIVAKNKGLMLCNSEMLKAYPEKYIGHESAESPAILINP